MFSGFHFKVKPGFDFVVQDLRLATAEADQANPLVCIVSPFNGVVGVEASAFLLVDEFLETVGVADQVAEFGLVGVLQVDGVSIEEIAAELKTTSARVSDEKYKAIRKLRQQLAV